MDINTMDITADIDKIPVMQGVFADIHLDVETQRLSFNLNGDVYLIDMYKQKYCCELHEVEGIEINNVDPKNIVSTTFSYKENVVVENYIEKYTFEVNFHLSDNSIVQVSFSNTHNGCYATDVSISKNSVIFFRTFL